MKKNILVLTASPRKNGNSIMLADAFIEGALKKGHDIVKFDAAEKDIKGCTACDACWSKDTACIYKDGFTQLEPLLESADVLVIATPLYWSSFPAQVKAPIDKLYAYVSDKCKRPLKIKESVLLACGECEEESLFNGLVETYKGIADYLEWTIAGIITVPKVVHIGDILNTQALKEAGELGEKI